MQIKIVMEPVKVYRIAVRVKTDAYLITNWREFVNRIK